MAPATEGGANGDGPVWRIPGGAARAAAHDGGARPRSLKRARSRADTTDAPTLQHIIERGGSLPLAAALVLLDDVLESLGRLHAAGIAHGHLRPAGVLVDRAGRCRLDETAVAPAPGSAGGGLLGYAAPEVRAGGPATPASDVYGATAVFFEALTGLPPLGGLDQARRDRAVPLLARSLLEEGMNPHLAERPASAAQLRRDIATAGRAFLDDDWREGGRTWLAGASIVQPAAQLAGSGAAPWARPKTPVPAPARVGRAPAPSADAGALSPRREVEIVAGDRPRLPFLLGGEARRDPRILAGIALGLAGLLVLLLVAALLLQGSKSRPSGPGFAPVTAPPSAVPTASGPVFGVSTPLPTPSPSPSPTPSPTPNPTPAPTPLPAGRNPVTFAPAPQPTAFPPPATPTACFLGIIC